MNSVSIPDRVESAAQNVKLGFRVETPDEDYDSYTEVGSMTDEELQTVATRMGTTPEFLKEINAHFEALKEAVHNDLADIWAKLA